MKKLIFSIAFVFIASSSLLINNCFSQWMPVFNGLGNNASILSMTTSGDNLFAGVYNYPTGASGVFISTNNGGVWSQTSLGTLYVPALATLGTTVFAGTIYPSSSLGNVYTTTNNGVNWTQTPMTKGVNAFAVMGNKIFAGTMNNGVYYSTDNGASWIQTSLNSQYILSLAVLGDNIFAGSGDENGIFVSTNGGAAWTQTTYTTQNVFSLAAIGNSIFAGTSGQGICYSTNNGMNWLMTPVTNQLIYSLSTIGYNIVAGSDGGGVFFSSNRGVNWSNVSTGIYSASPIVHAIQITSSYIFAGTYHYSVWRRLLSELNGTNTTGNEIPSVFSLSQNYPNPFNPVTKIKFEIAKLSSAKIVVTDITGREIMTLLSETLKPGTYETTFDGSKLNSGVYFYRLTAGDFSVTKKMMLIK